MVVGAVPRAAFFGAGEVGAAFLKHLIALRDEGACSLSGVHAAHPDDEAAQAVTAIASRAGLAHGSPGAAFGDEPLDIVISAGNHHLFEALARPRLGIVNFHGAPLPRFRGSACPAFAILETERQFGVSFHLVVAALDAGPIIHEQAFDILPDDTAADVDAHCITLGVAAFRAHARDWLHGRFEARPVVPAGPAYRRRDLEAHRKVDMAWAETRIWDHVRAFDWPGILQPAYTEQAGRKVYLSAHYRGRHIGGKTMP